MYNWDDPLGLGKKETVEKTAVVEKAKKNIAPKQVVKQPEQVAINHTPENKENNARVAVDPVKADDKRVINGHTDINQLAPLDRKSVV